MINLRLLKFLLILGPMISLCTSAWAFDLFIASHNSRTENFDQDTIVRILMANQLTWDDGKNILLLVSDIDSVSNDNFKKVSGQNKNDFFRTWRTKYFSGRAFMPTQIQETTTALERINSNPSILYISFEEFKLDAKKFSNLKIRRLTF